MKSLIYPLVAVMSLYAGAHAQVAATPQPNQPCSAQAQAAGVSNAAEMPKLTDDAKKKLAAKMKWLQSFVPVQLPDPGSLIPKPKAALPPCAPRAAAATVSPPAPTPTTAKLPPDAVVTLRCNPTISDPNADPNKSGLAGLTDYLAIPKANEFEVEKVQADTTASTPCYKVKIDPNTGKQFIKQ